MMALWMRRELVNGLERRAAVQNQANLVYAEVEL